MSLPIPTLPSTTGAFTLIAGPFSVNLPQTVTQDEDSFEGTSYFESIPGRHGLFKTRNQNYQGRTLSLSGFIYSADTVQSLKRVLSYGTVRVNRDSLTLEADVSSASVIKRVSDVLWRVEIELSSQNYYWEESTYTETLSSPTTVTNSGDLTVLPTFIVTAGVGGITAVTFEVSGRIAAWEGTSLASGEILTIDCENLQVFAGGEANLDYMNSSFFTNPPRFEPGDNSLSATITTIGTYKVRHSERFL